MRAWLVVAVLTVAVACGSTAPAPEAALPPEDALRVGSFDFDESVLLTELYAQAVEQAGIPVRRLGAIGPRELVEPAIEGGLLDLVPEYAGTLVTFLSDDPPSSDLDVVLERLRPLLEERDLLALQAAEAHDSNAFVVTGSLAELLDLAAISDLAGSASELRFGGPAECVDRPLCLAGLRDTYGLEFATFVTLRTLDLTAEALRRDEVDVALMFTTSAQLADGDLVVLADDRGLQPADNVVPIVTEDALGRWGERLVTAVDRVSSSLTTEDLVEMNRAVSDGRPPSEVAAEWLTGLTE